MQSKKIITFVLSVVLLIIANVFVVAAQEVTPRVWLASDIAQASAGQEFTVTINVDDAVQIYGSSFKLAYDPELFEVVLTNGKAIAPGAFFQDQQGFELKNTAASGVVDYALTLMQPAQPVSGNGALGTVTFRALQAAPVAITTTEASLVSPEFTEIDGRMVAQRINQVAAQIDNTLTASSPAVAQAPVNTAPDAASMFVNPELTVAPQTPAAPVSSNNLSLIFAGIFFTAGLVLLTVSVGMYSRMRVRFDLVASR